MEFKYAALTHCPNRLRERNVPLAVLLPLIVLAACGDRQSPTDQGPGPAGAAVRLEISPSALLLTGAGAMRQLTVQATDAAGQPAETSVTWHSTNPAVAGVAADGRVTAMAALGSAQIVAEAAGGVRSSPIVVLVAEPVDGAVLVDDEQVAAEPAAVSPDAEYGAGWRYRVRLRGMAQPDPGVLLLATGGARVAGRVVSAAAVGGEWDVTLEVVPLTELFQRLSIDESIELGPADIVPEPSFARHFDVRGTRSGALSLAPRTGAQPWRAAMAGAALEASEVEFEVGPFKCKAEVGLADIEVPVPSIVVEPRLVFNLVYDDGLELMSVEGGLDASFSIAPVLTVAFEGEVGCKAVAAKVIVPMSGAASFAFSAIIPIGIGFKLDGTLSVAQVGYELEVGGGVELDLGVTCPGGGACSPVTNFERRPVESSFRLITPDLVDDFRIELGFFAFTFAGLATGSPFSQVLQFEWLEAKAGIKQALDLKTMHAQAVDPDYASSFGLNSKISIGPGKDIRDGLEKLGKLLGRTIDVSISLFDDLEPLAVSPRGTFRIEPNRVAPGDDSQLGEMATFTVELDPVTYLGLNAVESVEIRWRKADGDNGGFTLQPGRPGCTLLPASPGQTTFTCQTDFLEEHVGRQTFHAFVHAKLFGVSLPIPLEIGADARASVDVGPKALVYLEECTLAAETSVHASGDGTSFFHNWEDVVSELCATGTHNSASSGSGGGVSGTATASTRLTGDVGTDGSFTSIALVGSASASLTLSASPDASHAGANGMSWIWLKLRVEGSEPVSYTLTGTVGERGLIGLPDGTHVDADCGSGTIPINTAGVLEPGWHAIHLTAIQLDVLPAPPCTGDGATSLTLTIGG